MDKMLQFTRLFGLISSDIAQRTRNNPALIMSLKKILQTSIRQSVFKVHGQEIRKALNGIKKEND